MPSPAEIFVQTIAAGLTKNSITSCSRWAEQHRVMGGAFGGRYSTKFHPWVKEILNSRAPFTWSMKAAQTGLTEAAINRAFYALDVQQRDVLYVLPTASAATDFSKARFGTALELSPHIKGMFLDVNSAGIKRAKGSTLYIRGSRGRDSLVSVPVGVMLLDEVDRMDIDRIWLALERLSGQLEKTVWGLSTPTVPGRGIHSLYMDTTQEHFFFKCPGCGKATELVWPDCIEIRGENVGDKECHDSYLKCKECGVKLEHKDKPNFLANGYWLPTIEDPNWDNRGFYVNQLYSSTVTPGELVIAYFRGFGSELAEKEFHNSKLGLPFVGQNAKVLPSQIDDAVDRGNYTMHDLRRPRSPNDGLFVIGMDQGKKCTVTVSEMIRDGEIFGDDFASAHIEKVCWIARYGMEEVWDRMAELMAEWQVSYYVCDADPELTEARKFCRKFGGFAATSRYRKVRTAKEIKIEGEETGAPMLTVDRTNWIDTALGRFKTGRIILPRDVPDWYREQLRNLTRTYERVKVNEGDKEEGVLAMWVNTGPDHAAHSLVYADLALTQAPMYSASSGRII